MFLALVYVSREASGVLVVLAAFMGGAVLLGIALQRWTRREVRPRIQS